MSEVIDRLVKGQGLAGAVCWVELSPVFQHAIALAKEAEYQASRASISAEMSIAPAYPVLVTMLAESMAPATSAEVPF